MSAREIRELPLPRQPYKPTEDQRKSVLTMTGLGIKQHDIAAMLAIDPKTLRLHFRRELDTGATEANMRVAKSLYTMATVDKQVAAAIWWTKARMGWKEARDPVAIEHAGAIDFRWADAVASP